MRKPDGIYFSEGIRFKDIDFNNQTAFADLITSNSLAKTLQEKVAALEKKNKKVKDASNKAKTENENLINKISEFNKEIERLQNLNWFDKI